MTPIEKVLLTWYKPDNPKYKDPLHPTLKLAGEIGELLDLYAKHLFKPGFDWLLFCKHCGENKHYGDNSCIEQKKKYTTCKTPLVLDELGDIWYYLRILAWQNEIKFLDNWQDYTKSELSVMGDNPELSIIKSMYNYANIGLQRGFGSEEIREIYYQLLLLLASLDYTIDQLTELNYQKLNSESTNHGWKDAV